MIRLVDVLKKVAPRARPEYLEAFDRGGPLLAKYGLTTAVELAPFLATILEETGGLVVTWESMRYTNAERICEVWPKRFPTADVARPFVNNEEKLANFVYANRMGNGPASSGDGYRNRGCGLIQNTGADDRRAASKFAGIDFVAHPELMLTADYALYPAVWEWNRSDLNKLARADDFRGITRIINGGYTNMAEREKWLAIVRRELDGKVIDLSAAGGAPTPAKRSFSLIDSAQAEELSPAAAPAPAKINPALVAAGAGTAAMAVAPKSGAHNFMETIMHPIPFLVGLGLLVVLVVLVCDRIIRYKTTPGKNLLSAFENDVVTASSYALMKVGVMLGLVHAWLTAYEPLLSDNSFLTLLHTYWPATEVDAVISAIGLGLRVITIGKTVPLPTFNAVTVPPVAPSTSVAAPNAMAASASPDPASGVLAGISAASAASS